MVGSFHNPNSQFSPVKELISRDMALVFIMKLPVDQKGFMT